MPNPASPVPGEQRSTSANATIRISGSIWYLQASAPAPDVFDYTQPHPTPVTSHARLPTPVWAEGYEIQGSIARRGSYDFPQL